MSDSLLCAHEGPVAVLTINRPEQRNALNAEVLGALRVRLAELSVDDNVHAVVLRGEGTKAFCSGFDLEEMVADDADRSLLVSVFQEMSALGKPIVAAVQGYALAGGMGLAVACDLVVADETAVFGLPEINVGLWPFVITIPLLQSLPAKVVIDLMMTGRRVNAEEAMQLGIASRVVSTGDFDQTIRELAAELAAKPQQSMRIGRQSFYDTLGNSIEPNFDELLAGFASVLKTDDAKEGIEAFREKRKPRWAQ